MVETYGGGHRSQRISKDELRKLLRTLHDAYKNIPAIKDQAKKEAASEAEQAEKDLSQALETLS